MQGVYHVRRKFKREYIISGGNLSGVYHFYIMAVTATTMVYKYINHSFYFDIEPTTLTFLLMKEYFNHKKNVVIILKSQ